MSFDELDLESSGLFSRGGGRGYLIGAFPEIFAENQLS